MALIVDLPVKTRTVLYNAPMVSFLYPKVLGIRDVSMGSSINNGIYSEMLEVCKELERQDVSTTVSGSYEIKNNQKDILSLSLIGLGDFGGAHPMTIIKSLNFDVSTGFNYEFYQLFKPGSDYLQVLSDMVYEQLKEQDIPLFEDSIEVHFNQDYYIADKSLVIYFQLYEVAPYYAGFPYAVIPIYSIQDMILEGGLLSKALSW